MLHLVTYATHSNGTFEKLINNDFGVEVVVLGWGKPWNGFSDKFLGVREYLKTLNDNDILVFMDGWDSFINKDPSQVEEIFNNMDCDILVSMDVDNTKKKFGTRINNINIKKVFGTCMNNITANSGMYMGKVKSLKSFLDKMLVMPCRDDQVKLNRICDKINRLKIDEENIIFQNTSPKDKNPKGIFVSLPGTSGGRWKRAFKEYSQFFVNNFIVLLISLILFFPKYKNIFYIFGFFILFLQLMYSDNSCIY